MQNTQAIEKFSKRTDDKLEVHSIFYTIQGEGPFCGTSAVFVRLAGCNLQCPFCDTDYTSNREEFTVRELIARIMQARGPLHGRSELVVITGGEPFRQDLGALFQALTQSGFFVQVETNGTLPPSDVLLYNYDIGDRRGVYIVCSPKAGKVHPRIETKACCFKYVVAHDSIRTDDGLPLQALGHTANPYVARPPAWWGRRPIYIQPMDAQDEHENRLNIEAAKQSAMRFGYILQLQIHKIIGVE